MFKKVLLEMLYDELKPNLKKTVYEKISKNEVAWLIVKVKKFIRRALRFTDY